jgi:hypothetical protein
LQIIELLSAAAVVLILSRNRKMRSVFAAAAISSASAGLWIVLLPRAIPALEMRGTRVDPMDVPLVFGALYSALVMLGLTIVPNLVALGTVRRLLQARRGRGTSLWATLTTRVFVVPVGVIYGEVGLVLTLVMWTLLFALALRSAYPLNFILVYPKYPLLHVTAMLGGITAIWVQGALDRRASAPVVPEQAMVKM